MATRIETPSIIDPTPADWQLLMSGLSKRFGGCQLVYLTNWFSTGAPTIPAGAKIEIRGMFFESLVEEGIEDIEAVNNGTVYIYVKVQPDEMSAHWYASNYPPNLVSELNGWYSNDKQDRCFFEMQKNSSTYVLKRRIGAEDISGSIFGSQLASQEIEGSVWVNIPPTVSRFINITGCSAGADGIQLTAPRNEVPNLRAGGVFIRQNILNKWKGTPLQINFSGGNVSILDPFGEQLFFMARESGTRVSDIVNVDHIGGAINGNANFIPSGFSRATASNTPRTTAGSMIISPGSGWELRATVWFNTTSIQGPPIILPPTIPGGPPLVFPGPIFMTTQYIQIHIRTCGGAPGIGNFLRILNATGAGAGANGGGGGGGNESTIISGTLGNGGYGGTGGCGLYSASAFLPTGEVRINPGRGGPAICLMEWG